MIAACVFAFFGDTLIEPFVQGGAGIRDYAFTVDQLGNIFYIRSERDNRSLIVLDSTGEELLRADIGEHFDGEFFVDNIYVLQNKNVWVTAYGYDPQTLIINSVKIAAFREDGSYIEDIYNNRNLHVFKDSMYRRVSSCDEDERCVYFALRDESDVLSVYIYVKDGSEPLRKLGEYATDYGDVIAFHALPGGGAIISYSDGTLQMHSALGTESLPGGGQLAEASAQARGGVLGDVRITRFLSGAGVVYMYDAVGGSYYSTPANQLRPIRVIGGTFAASGETGVYFRDMHETSVSGVGNVLGVIRTDTGSRLYMGGFTFLPHIASVSHTGDAEMANWLVVFAAVAGIIISSVLIWEFYVNFMRMKMSMIVRQALLTALVIFIAFFILSEYLLIPSVTDALGEAYRESLSSDADVLLASMNASVPRGSPGEEYERFMEGFGSLYNARGAQSGPLYTYLAVPAGGTYTLAASSARHPTGVALSAFLPYPGIADTLGALKAGGRQFLTLETETGRQLAYLRHTGAEIGGGEAILCVVQNLYDMEERVASFSLLVNTFLAVSGTLLAVMMILTAVFHVITLKRLSRILHFFTLGEYQIRTEIHSGDETGDMFEHISKLSHVLSDKDRGLTKLTTSYHRFIPERFLKLLGESRVENVSKNMQTYIEGAYVLFIRFELSGGSAADVFTNTNIILEQIVPVVGQHGGTVYGFTSNGFDGVFEKSATDALSAALSVRDVCRRLNTKMKNEHGFTVDLRATLTKDNLTLGFIGDESRMEPVAISDAGAVAEALMKICFGSNIYIAATDEFCSDIKKSNFRIRNVGVTPAGDGNVSFFDIYDSDPPALHEIKKSFDDKFQLGVSLFAKGDYGNAGKMFMDIIKHSTEDGAARNYVYLCEYNLRNADKQRLYTAAV